MAWPSQAPRQPPPRPPPKRLRRLPPQCQSSRRPSSTPTGFPNPQSRLTPSPSTSLLRRRSPPQTLWPPLGLRDLPSYGTVARHGPLPVQRTSTAALGATRHPPRSGCRDHPRCSGPTQSHHHDFWPRGLVQPVRVLRVHARRAHGTTVHRPTQGLARRRASPATHLPSP